MSKEKKQLKALMRKFVKAQRALHGHVIDMHLGLERQVGSAKGMPHCRLLLTAYEQLSDALSEVRDAVDCCEVLTKESPSKRQLEQALAPIFDRKAEPHL